LGKGPFSRAHAADCECAEYEVVAEGDEIGWGKAEELHDHVPSDAHFAFVWAAEDTSQALGKSVVPAMARDWCRELSILFRVEFEAPREVKSQSMAWRTSVCIGITWLRAWLAVAQARTVCQLRQALSRVALAEPKGTTCWVNAWLLAAMVGGVDVARRAIIGSQLPWAPSSADVWVLSRRAIVQ
jgi:hypothetical protein